MNVAPSFEDTVPHPIPSIQPPFAEPSSRLVRVLLVAVIFITCVCLSRMADGQVPPSAQELPPGTWYTVALPAQTSMAPATHAQTPSPIQPVGHTVQPASSMFSGEGMIDESANCGCRNLPGGYPCTGACQPCIKAVDCAANCGAEGTWQNMQPSDFNSYAQGGYAGPARLAHLSEYRLRPGDQLEVIYLVTRRQSNGAYRLEVGDELLIEVLDNEELTRGNLEKGIQVQPDGTITVRLIGQVHAAGLTVEALRKQLSQQYERYYEKSSLAIDVTPVKTNTLAEDIRNAVGGRSGLNRQSTPAVVMPDGKVRLPGLGEICVQGYTLNEMKSEVNLRYAQTVVGLEVEPILTSQAPHFVHVLGEVRTPNRVELQGPTTVLSAIASAGGQLPSANMRQVVIFRRAEDWRLLSTMLDLQGAVYGKRPTPADEIWLRDGDVVIVPAKPIARFNWFVQQVFTEGVYGVVPFGVSYNFGDAAQ